MNTIFKKLIQCIAILLLSACATLPETPVEGIPTIVPVKPSLSRPYPLLPRHPHQHRNLYRQYPCPTPTRSSSPSPIPSPGRVEMATPARIGKAGAPRPSPSPRMAPSGLPIPLSIPTGCSITAPRASCSRRSRSRTSLPMLSTCWPPSKASGCWMYPQSNPGWSYWTRMANC